MQDCSHFSVSQSYMHVCITQSSKSEGEGTKDGVFGRPNFLLAWTSIDDSESSDELTFAIITASKTLGPEPLPAEMSAPVELRAEAELRVLRVTVFLAEESLLPYTCIEIGKLPLLIVCPCSYGIEELLCTNLGSICSEFLLSTAHGPSPRLCILFAWEHYSLGIIPPQITVSDSCLVTRGNSILPPWVAPIAATPLAEVVLIDLPPIHFAKLPEPPCDY